MEDLHIIPAPSPNYWPGRAGYKPIAIVLHKCEGAGSGCVAWTRNPRSQRSYHYIVLEDGKIAATVTSANTAWHAGKVCAPTWPLLKAGVNPNLYTIGVSLAGFSKDKCPPKQWQGLANLVAHLSQKHGIPLDRQHLVFHSEICRQKSDPGPYVKKEDLIALATA